MSKRSDLLVALMIAIAVLELFWPVGAGGWINFDDFESVPDNPHVSNGLSIANARWAFSTGTFAYWHPVMWLTLQADVQCFGVGAAPIRLDKRPLAFGRGGGLVLGVDGGIGPAAPITERSKTAECGAAAAAGNRLSPGLHPLCVE